MKSLSLALVATAACGAAPRAPAVEQRPASPTTTPGESIAAAGLYWLPYKTCDDCAIPAAIVAYIARDEAEARTIKAALGDRLGLGLPYVVDADELGIEPRGIAIVTGTYASRAAADRALAGTPALGGRAAAAFDVVHDPYSPEFEQVATRIANPAHRVTVVDRGGPVPAWSKADVEAAQDAQRDSNDPRAKASIAAMHAFVRSQVRAHRPLCMVQPGELFVVETADIAWYELAPVRCGDQLAYVEWTASLLGHAVIVPDRGGHRLSQVVGAQCDTEKIESWSYDETGRHAPTEPPAEGASGC